MGGVLGVASMRFAATGVPVATSRQSGLLDKADCPHGSTGLLARGLALGNACLGVALGLRVAVFFLFRTRIATCIVLQELACRLI